MGEIALFNDDHRVSDWKLVIDGRVRFEVTEYIRAMDVKVWARIPPPPHLMIAVDAYIAADLRPGDTLQLHDLRLDALEKSIGGFQSVVDEELPEPDEDYDQDPYEDDL